MRAPELRSGLGNGRHHHRGQATLVVRQESKHETLRTDCLAGETEHFWLTDVSFENGEFKGTINNDPGMVGNVKIGQSWTVRKDGISDWMFMRGGKMYGNYTMRPLLKTMPEAEAAKYRSMLADP